MEQLLNFVVGFAVWYGIYRLAKYLFTRGLVKRLNSLEERLVGLEQRAER